jgi:hypothetical protein
MRPLIIAIPVSLLLVAPLAGAQSQDYPRSDSTPVSTVQVTPPPGGILVTSDQAESIKGTYEMSNGWLVKVQPVPATHGMIAQIDRQPAMRLIALTGDRFVTPDGNVAMEFGRGDFRDGVTMSYLPGSSLADNGVGRVTVASR